MNKTPASVLFPTPIQFPTTERFLLQQHLGTIRPYVAPNYVVNAPDSYYGVAFRCTGIPMLTCENLAYETSKVRLKNIIFQPAVNPLQTTNIGYGSAPTRGIYTGISHEGCE